MSKSIIIFPYPKDNFDCHKEIKIKKFVHKKTGEVIFKITATYNNHLYSDNFSSTLKEAKKIASEMNKEFNLDDITCA